MFSQPYYDLFVKLAKWTLMEFTYFGDHSPSASPGYAHGGGRCYI